MEPNFHYRLRQILLLLYIRRLANPSTSFRYIILRYILISPFLLCLDLHMAFRLQFSYKTQNHSSYLACISHVHPPLFEVNIFGKEYKKHEAPHYAKFFISVSSSPSCKLNAAVRHHNIILRKSKDTCQAKMKSHHAPNYKNTKGGVGGVNFTTAFQVALFFLNKMLC